MENRILFDFSSAGSIDSWRNIDDVVMGGQSRSQLSWNEEGSMVFAGTLCSDPGSGFASIRSNPDRFDLGQYRGLALQVKGDGLRYKLSLRCEAALDAIAYQASFATEADTDQTLLLPWSAFVASYHGRLLETAPALDPGQIRSFGFVVANKQSGPFRLEIIRLEAVAEEG